jgi:hypothetical protein
MLRCWIFQVHRRMTERHCHSIVRVLLVLGPDTKLIPGGGMVQFNTKLLLKATERSTRLVANIAASSRGDIERSKPVRELDTRFIEAISTRGIEKWHICYHGEDAEVRRPGLSSSSSAEGATWWLRHPNFIGSARKG